MERALNFWKKITLPFFSLKSRFQTFVVHFFSISELVFQFWFCSTKIILYCASFGFTPTKFTSCGASTHFLKSYICHLFTQFQTSNVSLSLFFLLQSLVLSYLTLTNFKKNFLRFFGRIRKMLPSVAQARMFRKKT